MKKKRLLSLVMTVMILFGCAVALPEDTFISQTEITASAIREKKRSGDFEYYVRDDDTICISEYLSKNNPNIRSIYVPSKIDGKAVTTIGGYAFYISSYLTEIILPESVTTIAPSAISHCSNLKTVKLPQSLQTIGGSAFEYCHSLNNVVIPDGVTYIGGKAFYECTNLSDIQIPKNTSLGGDVLFKTKWLREQLQKGPMVILSGILIDAKGCSGNIVIPSNVSSIAGSAFDGNTKIKSVKFHSGVKEIGYTAFKGCTGLTSITIPGSVKEIGGSAFDGCTNLEKAVIKDGTKEIGGNIFNNCYKLKNVVLSKDIISIPQHCFTNCYALTGLSLPNDITMIGNNAFRNCTALKSIKIPYGVAQIGAFAFMNCGELKSVSLPNSLKTIDQDAFTGCVNLKSLTIPKSLTTTYSWCFGYDMNHNKISGFKATLYKDHEKMINMCKIDGIAYEIIIPNRRIAGDNRFATAAEIAKKSFDKADMVILAYGYNYADALAGVPLASKLNAPILLTDKNDLPKETTNAIEKLSAKKVIILGGPGAISAKVEKTLKDNKLETERIAGVSRFETATKIAQNLNEAPTEIFFVNGLNYPDALSIGSVAAIKNAPIIYLTTSGNLDADTAKYLAQLKKKGSVKKAYVIGGKGAISDDMMKKAYTALGLKSAERVAGADRFETCVEINNKFGSVLDGNSICVATGMNFPDALAGGVFAAKNKAPLFLINSNAKTLALSKTQQSFLKKKAATNLTVFGGTGAVPDSHVKTVAKASV